MFRVGGCRRVVDVGGSRRAVCCDRLGRPLRLRWKSGCYREVWWRRLPRESNNEVSKLFR